MPAPTDADRAERDRERIYQRPPGTLTVEMVTEALRQSAGIRSFAATKLQVHRSTITRFIQAHPEIAEAEAEIVEELADVAEGKLLEGIRDGQFPSIKFFLENKARDRGYGRNLELSGPGGKPIGVSAQPAFDYSKLTVEELEQLEAIMAKASPALPAPEGIEHIDEHADGHPDVD